MRIPIISLWEPHASLMAMGLKKVETRGHKMPNTLLGNVVGIHSAARRVTQRELKAYLELDAFREAFAPNAGVLTSMRRYTMGKAFQALPYGSIVAVTRFNEWKQTEDVHVDWREFQFGSYAHGRFAWLTENVIAIPPIPAKGKRGVWYHEVPDEYITRLVELEQQ